MLHHCEQFYIIFFFGIVKSLQKIIYKLERRIFFSKKTTLKMGTLMKTICTFKKANYITG